MNAEVLPKAVGFGSMVSGADAEGGWSPDLGSSDFGSAFGISTGFGRSSLDVTTGVVARSCSLIVATSVAFSLVSSADGMGAVTNKGLSVMSLTDVGAGVSAPGEGVRGGSVIVAFGVLMVC